MRSLRRLVGVLLLFMVVVPTQPSAYANPYIPLPFIVSSDWAWAPASISPAHWPPLNDYDDQEWDFLSPYAAYEDDGWWQRAKPYLLRDIDDMLAKLGIDQGNPQWRHSLNLEVNMPAFVLPMRSGSRASAIVRRFFETALERDLPVAFKVQGYVYWDCKGLFLLSAKPGHLEE